tara:strand:+ start:726 stop:947 length:222 start_codon:yes stop_codon:yes gene_type:complete
MKVTNDVLTELGHIRNAIDDVYNRLDTVLYRQKTAAKSSYTSVKPFDLISENIEYIVQRINNIRDNAEVVGDE